MKKSLLVIMLFLGFVLQEPVYDKVDTYVRCKDVYAMDGYVERVYFVKEGLLMKLVEYEFIPFCSYESQDAVDEVFYELMDAYVYRGYLHVGYSSMAPYYTSDGIMNPYKVVDFTNLFLFSCDEVSNAVKTQDRKSIIFELYLEMYEESKNCSL